MDEYNKIPEFLSGYTCKLTREPDFDDFWNRAIEDSKKVQLNEKKELQEYPCNSVNIYKISYNGYDETDVVGWMIIPKNMTKKVSCIIHYHGFGGNKGYPHEYLPYTDLGFAVLTIDIRGQNGETGDMSSYKTGGSTNVMCHGVLDKNEYYLKKVYIDAIKAIDYALTWEEIDEERIIINGGSQGGGIGMAVVGLDKRPVFCFSDVPSNSNIERRILEETGSFGSISEYLKRQPSQFSQVMKTISYFDIMNMAENISCEVYSSVALRDNVCPAICYFATYNLIKTKKEIFIYPLNGHEGGGAYHTLKRLEKLKALEGNLDSKITL